MVRLLGVIWADSMPSRSSHAHSSWLMAGLFNGLMVRRAIRKSNPSCKLLLPGCSLLIVFCLLYSAYCPLPPASCSAVQNTPFADKTSPFEYQFPLTPDNNWALPTLLMVHLNHEEVNCGITPHRFLGMLFHTDRDHVERLLQKQSVCNSSGIPHDDRF